MNNIGDEYFQYVAGCIEVMDNVFIGSGTIILPNVKIGSNVIIGSGSIITHDIEDGSVVAGVPAKKIGTFDDYMKKRRKYTYLTNDELWDKFNKEKGINNE